jgi:hypothetical protein
MTWIIGAAFDKRYWGNRGVLGLVSPSARKIITLVVEKFLRERDGEEDFLEIFCSSF